MRDIKFRAWDKLLEQMIYQGHRSLAHYFSASITEDSPLMQYTGLKDKNGKEIYEGDVVHDVYYRDNGWNDWKVESKGYVKFINGSFCLICTSDIDGSDMYDELYKRMNPNDTKAIGSVEVIGNIYENPDLLQTERG